MTNTELLKTRICIFCKQSCKQDQDYDYNITFGGWFHDECLGKHIMKVNEHFDSLPRMGFAHCRCWIVADEKISYTEEQSYFIDKIYEKYCSDKTPSLDA